MSDPWDDYAAAPSSTNPADGPWAVFASPKSAQKVAPPPVPGPKPNAFTDIAGYVANAERGTGIGDEMAAGLGTGLTAVSDVVTGKQSLPNAFMTLPQRFDDRLKSQRQLEDGFVERHPLAAENARGLGMGALVFAPELAPEAVVGTRLGNMGRGGLAAATTAAGYSLADRGTPQERGQAATQMALNPLMWGLGAAGGFFAPTAAKVGKPVDSNVKMLAKEGVDNMTPGQINGGWAKVMEDHATSLPILGPAIQDARNASLDTFNRAGINRSLAPIGETLPEGLNSGYAAVKYAGDKLSAAYKKVLPEGGVYADQEFSNAVAGLPDVISTLTPARQKQVTGIVQSRVIARLKNDNKVLSGDVYKQVESELGTLISRYGQSTDGDQRGMADALTVVKDALSDAAARQNPKFAAEKAKIDAGWANLVPVERAAANTGAEGGRFTPAQFDQSVKAGNDTVRKRGYGRGDATGQDLATAGRAVLPSKVGDSGSAGRGMMSVVASVPGAVLGGLTGGGWGAAAGIAGTAGGLTAASRMYSESAIAAANKALSTRISAQEREAAMQELGALASKNPQAAAIYQEVQTRLSRALGIGGSAAQGQQSRGQAIGRP
jgi:hypothetical protein